MRAAIDAPVPLPIISLMASPQDAALELIGTYYHTFNSGDREAMLALLSEDVVHDINQGDSERSRQVFRAFLQRMDRCYREQVEELVVFANAEGTRAAAEFFILGTYLESDAGLPPAKGQTYRLRVGAFFEITDGLITRVTNYYNLEDWLRQVGAGE